MNKSKLFLVTFSMLLSSACYAQKGLIEIVEHSDSVEGESISIRNGGNFLDISCLNKSFDLETNLKGNDGSSVTVSVDENKYVFGTWRNTPRGTLDIKRSGLASLSKKIIDAQAIRFETDSISKVFRLGPTNRQWITACLTGSTERRIVKYAPAKVASNKKALAAPNKPEMDKINQELEEIKSAEERLLMDLNVENAKSQLKQLDSEVSEE